MRKDESFQGDRRVSNPRQPEPQGSAIAVLGLENRRFAKTVRAKKTQETPYGKLHSVPGTGIISGCLARYEHDGIVRMCLHDVADHVGPHADADGCWLVDGKVTVVDPVYRARWSSDGAWWI